MSTQKEIDYQQFSEDQAAIENTDWIGRKNERWQKERLKKKEDEMRKALCRELEQLRISDNDAPLVTQIALLCLKVDDLEQQLADATDQMMGDDL